ncbi:YggT family protein [Alteraurantiacibacter aquimixticola]|uniref:YggT family protein n=1 Tax=Alteraurantiacibacter aquimixticola TaxID=2489173 RepID=A0A4T3EZ98_9SPHN|nr:YggT family protein [Alteraurantiacibacter aquimixticola]TIX48864.1 YggT family protein [Alteraurantiacibacter aquimixticola]
MVLMTIAQIISMLASVLIFLVIAQFVLSLLISFNVVNMHNDFVAAIWRAINALLDPLLNPIRKIMPNTGAIDFSPLVLIIGLRILEVIVTNMAISYAY